MSFSSKKIKISIVMFAVITLLFAIFIINPLFKEIKKSSQDYLLQKKVLANIQAKEKSFRKIKVAFKNYQPNLEKIDTLFVDLEEPKLDFIKFLEKNASDSNLTLTISPGSQLKGAPWPSINFTLTLKGSFLDFLRFLEKLEASPFLIKILNLSARRLPEKEMGKKFSVGDVEARLSIKVYTLK